MQFSKKGYKDEQFSGTTRHITTYVQTISALFQRRTPDLIPFFFYFRIWHGNEWRVWRLLNIWTSFAFPMRFFNFFSKRSTAERAYCCGVKKKHASKFTDILPYKYSNNRANNKLIVYVQNKNKNPIWKNCRV